MKATLPPDATQDALHGHPDAARIQSEIHRNDAERRRALWALPIVTDVEAALLVGLPVSTWHAIKRSSNPPPVFSVAGTKRRYVSTKRLLAWIEGQQS
jgi:hypothetical protein